MTARLLLSWAAALLFSLIALTSRGQAYEPGWVVRSSGDTLRGEVENGFWQEPPTYIRFRPSASSASELFKPRQLRAVGLRSGRYFRYEALPIDYAAQTNLVSLPRGNTSDVHIDTLLAEVLLAGPANLLRVMRPGTTHYLIQQPGRPVLELSDRKYLRALPNGNWAITDGNNYRAHLVLYFSDCAAARAAAETAAFTPASLVGVIQAYNRECSPARQAGQNWLLRQPSTARRRLAFQGGVLAGLRYNRIESPSANVNGPCVDCGVHPFAGLYAELLQPGRNTAVYGELSGSQFTSQVAEYAGFSQGNNLFSRVDYKAWLGTARIGLRRFFPLPHERQWFVGAGFELNFVFQPRVTAMSSPPPLYFQESDLDEFASPTLFPHLGLGWRSQRLTLSLDGQLYQSKAQENKESLISPNFALRLGLGYRLGRNSDVAP
jgi:hypothetical protein